MDILDENHSLLGFDNGVYDLEASVFRAGLPDDAVSLSTKYAFATEDDMEIQQQIHDFLDSCLESSDVKTYMLQVIASALYGRNVRERFFVFKGTGGNGEHLVCFHKIGVASGCHLFPNIHNSVLSSRTTFLMTGCQRVPPFPQHPQLCAQLPDNFSHDWVPEGATFFPNIHNSVLSSRTSCLMTGCKRVPPFPQHPKTRCDEVLSVALQAKVSCLISSKKTFGGYYGTLDSEFFTKTSRNSGQATPELADKKGKRIVLASEQDDNEKFQVKRIKLVSGGG